ncbi:13945_t:CDS:2, partial [Acaulospora colombiana]
MSAPLPTLGTPRDVYRYRKQRGVNLVTPSHKIDFSKIASGPDARQILEQHWANWIKDEDWQWIIDHGYNTVRIPVGYYHLCGVEPRVIHNTDFGGFQSVFEGAWGYVEKAIAAANHLHAAPGAQNPDAHSGTGSGKVRMWDDKNADATTFALHVLLSQVNNYDNVVGIELLNEPNNMDWLPEWYAWTLKDLRGISIDIPLYIADDADRAKYGDQHAAEIRDGVAKQFRDFNKQSRGNLIVGEFSAALGE